MNLATLKVVEVEKAIPVVEDEEALKSLAGHPGFVMLMQRLRNQRAVVKAHLENDHHESIREVEVLQAGLKWLNYLQGEVDRATAKKSATVEVKPPADQLQDFHKVLSLLESV